jgi:hypothetical protein
VALVEADYYVMIGMTVGGCICSELGALDAVFPMLIIENWTTTALVRRTYHRGMANISTCTFPLGMLDGIS